MKTVGILIVGDEVLSGEVRDENGPYLIGRLTSAGSRVVRMAVVADRADDIVRDLVGLRAHADAVVVSGGIGPTHDDVTRPAVAVALGVAHEEHPDALAQIRRWYGDQATDAELAMSLRPRGSRVLRGVRTAALGFAVAGVYVLPGVPFLLKDLVEGMATDFAGSPLAKEEVHTERREGEIADALTAIQAAALDVAIGSYPSVGPDGRWRTRIVLRGSDPERVADVASRVRSSLSLPTVP